MSHCLLSEDESLLDMFLLESSASPRGAEIPI